MTGEAHDHEDLRKQAVEAVANYMHHRLFDVIPTNMLPWVRTQADTIVSFCDTAIEHTKVEGKRRGVIK